MPHHDVNGASLYFETDGDPANPTLLLMHAGVAQLRMWDPVVGQLAETHHVVRFDGRGCGQTETQNVEFSPRADALAILDHLDVLKAVLIGCSRGGTVAIDMALESPGRVRGLVVIGAAPSGFPDVGLTAREDEMFDELDRAFADRDWETLNRREAALWGFGPLRTEHDFNPDFVETVYELNWANLPHSEERPAPVPLEPPAYDRLSDIAVPVLVTVGDHDISEVLVQFEYLATAIPGADACRFPDAAHLPSVEQPDDFARVVTAWLTEHEL